MTEHERQVAARYYDIISGEPPGIRRVEPKPKRRFLAFLKRKD